MFRCVNTAGSHTQASVYTFDEMPPIDPLRIDLQQGWKSRRLTLEPGDAELPFSWSRGAVKLALPRLEIHAAIVVD